MNEGPSTQELDAALKQAFNSKQGVHALIALMNQANSDLLSQWLAADNAGESNGYRLLNDIVGGRYYIVLDEDNVAASKEKEKEVLKKLITLKQPEILTFLTVDKKGEVNARYGNGFAESLIALHNAPQQAQPMAQQQAVDITQPLQALKDRIIAFRETMPNAQGESMSAEEFNAILSEIERLATQNPEAARAWLGSAYSESDQNTMEERFLTDCYYLIPQENQTEALRKRCEALNPHNFTFKPPEHRRAPLVNRPRDGQQLGGGVVELVADTPEPHPANRVQNQARIAQVMYDSLNRMMHVHNQGITDQKEHWYAQALPRNRQANEPIKRIQLGKGTGGTTQRLVRIDLQDGLKISARQINDDSKRMMVEAAKNYTNAVKQVTPQAPPQTFTIRADSVEAARALVDSVKGTGVQISKVLIKNDQGNYEPNAQMIQELRQPQQPAQQRRERPNQ